MDAALSNSDLLFHYTSVQTALEKILEEGTLRFSPITLTDDPLEFNGYDHHSAIGSIELVDKIAKQRPKFQEELKKSKIACFCQTEDISNKLKWGCSRSRMWSQHASGHTGVCLAFSQEKLEASIKSSLSERTSLFSEPVDYTDSPRHLQADMRILRDECPDPVARVEQVAPFYYFSKRNDYRDENEYRLVLYDPSYTLVSSEYVDCIDALDTIILGCRTPDCYTGLFLDITTRLSINLRKINWYSTDSVRFDNLSETNQ